MTLKNYDPYEIDVNEIRKIMIDENIETISSLAKKSHINRGTLSSVLKKERYPTAPVMYGLVSALNIPPEKAGKIFFTRKLT